MAIGLDTIRAGGAVAKIGDGQRNLFSDNKEGSNSRLPSCCALTLESGYFTRFMRRVVASPAASSRTRYTPVPTILPCVSLASQVTWCVPGS